MRVMVAVMSTAVCAIQLLSRVVLCYRALPCVAVYYRVLSYVVVAVWQASPPTCIHARVQISALHIHTGHRNSHGHSHGGALCAGHSAEPEPEPEPVHAGVLVC